MKAKNLFIGFSLAVLLIFTLQLASSNQTVSTGNEYFSFFSSGDTDLEQIHERYQLHNRLGDCDGDCDCNCEGDGDCNCDCDCDNLCDQIQDMIRDRIKDKLQDGSCQD